MSSKRKNKVSATIQPNKYHVWLAAIQSTRDVLTVTIKKIPWIAGFYFGYLSIKELAGKVTLANIFAQVNASLGSKVNGEESGGVQWWLYLLAMSLIFGILGVSYGLYQRRKRKINIKDLSNTIARLEEKIDPGRTSSNITPMGDSREEDKL